MSNASKLTLALALCAALSGPALARDYKLGCADGFCVIVDDTGRITDFSIGDKTLRDGADQLKVLASDRIRSPLNISCGAGAGGPVCVVTDADGHIWTAPARAGATFGEPAARIPVPGPR